MNLSIASHVLTEHGLPFGKFWMWTGQLVYVLTFEHSGIRLIRDFL